MNDKTTFTAEEHVARVKEQTRHLAEEFTNAIAAIEKPTADAILSACLDIAAKTISGYNDQFIDALTESTRHLCHRALDHRRDRHPDAESADVDADALASMLAHSGKFDA
ncbi:MAG: hypothetical protein HWE26_13810 [Alteromonadaceae bacterium]|nr:hypothetical protein [Alteromonadaceae bacterium]